VGWGGKRRKSPLTPLFQRGKLCYDNEQYK
jgi:hypothetical protein